MRKYTLHLNGVFLTLGCSVAMKRTVLKSNMIYTAKPNWINKLYDFKSHKVLNFIFVMFNAVDSNIVYVIFLTDCYSTQRFVFINLQWYKGNKIIEHYCALNTFEIKKKLYDNMFPVYAKFAYKVYHIPNKWNISLHSNIWCRIFSVSSQWHFSRIPLKQILFTRK